MKKCKYILLVVLFYQSLFAQLSIVSSDVIFYEKPLVTTTGIYFSGQNIDVGIEPYFLDGVNAPVLLKDINTGVNDSYASQFTEFQSKIYFSASNFNLTNFEIWSTDGTQVGTNLFTEINPSTSNGSYPTDFIVLGSNLIFSARDSGSNVELYSTDGTVVGTGLLKEISASTTFGSSPEYKILYNGQVFFSASNGGANNGFEVWSTDGTTAGTNLFYDVNLGTSNSNPTSFYEHDGILYFLADNGVNGRELWKTDGSTAGTELVADIRVGSADAFPFVTKFISFQSKLYFTANDGVNGQELWVHDSVLNTTQMVTDLNVGSDSSPHDFWVFNNYLFFSANDGIHGEELYVLDGSTNIVSVLDINTSGDSFAKIQAIMNNKLYLIADDGIAGYELWVSDGTMANTTLVADIEAGSASTSFNYFVVYNNELFFSTNSTIYKFDDVVLNTDDFRQNKYFTVFPNPTTSFFRINSKQDIQKVEVYDILGKKVKAFNREQEIYNVDDLISGIYLVKIFGNKAESTVKIVKK